MSLLPPRETRARSAHESELIERTGQAILDRNQALASNEFTIPNGVCVAACFFATFGADEDVNLLSKNRVLQHETGRNHDRCLLVSGAPERMSKSFKASDADTYWNRSGASLPRR